MRRSIDSASLKCTATTSSTVDLRDAGAVGQRGRVVVRRRSGRTSTPIETITVSWWPW